MTCAPSEPGCNAPYLPINEALLALVRMMARETARSDFATRRDGEVTNG
ncbi:hypothetical protein [Aliiruegeria lutimaris]|uniref:Uncharacterized protein n=1 Tax=Aliiruegeria lutimaris TaxID=571298 RepID=A0A1G9QCN7_9RHOB|nr:hypothetical protein [Aliiruegeria lutimaris]SDM08713.1 hypothetical protein SAMN04488026_11681 [Aliiruegeria lutimaris]